MSYQVLARKWRPQTFSELVGQEHVVAAISNALDNDRLHHAYLFTGTRGVGKTTIARIFSKSLNCEQGMSSSPCGSCGTCKEIEQGNFIDLLEIDAASRTKVEDTRELLDNVQYKPTRGQYKVYLIDEVHMLSKHSFNALLKTLEEPPPHVKFLLATTDPQKLPVTILSRCLQFNLKALSRAQIGQQLAHILQQESLPHEAEAIAQIARAAQGSMRDALSLTDQAIAQGDGQVSKQVVTDMLGLMDKGQIIKLVHAVLSKNSAQVMEQVEQLSFQAPDYNQVLAEIMSLLHQVALTQFVPDACKLETVSARAIFQLAKSMPPEQVQLCYQIALQGKKDLPYAADGRAGLEMTLLRMLAFQPEAITLSADDIGQLSPVSPVSLSDTDPMIQEETQSASHPHKVVTEEVAPQAFTESDSLPNVTPSNLVPPADGLVPESSEAPVAMHDLEHQDVQHQLNAEQQDTLAMAAQLHPEGQFEQSDSNYTSEAPVGFFEEQPTGLSEQENPSYVQPAAEQPSVDAASSTQDLLALRKQLRQESEQEKEDQSAAVKKSEQPAQDSIGRILASKAAASINQPTIEPDISEQTASSPAPTAHSVNSDDSPPWHTTESAQHESVVDGPERPQMQAASEPQIEPEPEFDPLAHLQESTQVEVDFEVPAFLEDGQKVFRASQLDTWSQLIEQMNLAALTKQLALHSSYSKQDNTVTLTLLQDKQHLNTESARRQLQEALSNAFQAAIELVVKLDEPKNTPFAVQQSINTVRQAHAEQVVTNNPAFQLLRESFDGSVVEGTIKPR